LNNFWYPHPGYSPRKNGETGGNTDLLLLPKSYSMHTTAFLLVPTLRVESKTCLGLQPTRRVGTRKIAPPKNVCME